MQSDARDGSTTSGKRVSTRLRIPLIVALVFNALLIARVPLASWIQTPENVSHAKSDNPTGGASGDAPAAERIRSVSPAARATGDSANDRTSQETGTATEPATETAGEHLGASASAVAQATLNPSDVAAASEMLDDFLRFLDRDSTESVTKELSVWPTWLGQSSGSQLAHAFRGPVFRFQGAALNRWSAKPADGLRLFNPDSTQGAIHFVIDGKVVSLASGQTHRASGSGPWLVAFHRGASHGDSTHTCRPGAYRFDVDAAGWRLSEVQ